MPRFIRISRLASIAVRSCDATARAFALDSSRATLLIQQAMLSVSFIRVSLDIMRPFCFANPTGPRLVIDGYGN